MAQSVLRPPVANLGILARINHGYDHLEPVILGLMAMHMSFMLIGRHGTGKTRLARILSRGHGDGGFGFFDATKDDLISIAGIPDVQAMNAGSLRFIPHERSIWNKTTVVVDEITRAGKESQNLWLEILEDRTCFGLPLAYHTLIATANPESYAAAFQLDEALLDRFYAVLPVPEMQEDLSAEDVAAMIALAADATTPNPAELVGVFALIQTAHAELLAEGARERISRYLSQLVPELMAMLRRSDCRYVSARTYARNLPEAILAIAAYFRAAGADKPLRRGAVEALRYVIATKLQIQPAALEQIHRAVEALLGGGAVPEVEALRIGFSGLESFEHRLAYLEKHWGVLQQAMRPDEMEKMLGTLLLGASSKGDRNRLVQLRAVLARVGYVGDGLRQVDGLLVLTFRRAVTLVAPHLAEIARTDEAAPRLQLARANVRRFLEMDAKGTLLADHSLPAVRLKRYLIEALESDVPTDRTALVELFADAQLSAAG